MHRWDALMVMTMWEARGAWQSSRQRDTAASIVTVSKERPSNSALSARFIGPSSRPGSRVAGVPEMAPLGLDPGCGGSLAHSQTGMLVGAEKTPELEVIVARQALEPTPEVAPQHG